jgi:hypothetical protein
VIRIIWIRRGIEFISVVRVGYAWFVGLLNSSVLLGSDMLGFERVIEFISVTRVGYAWFVGY